MDDICLILYHALSGDSELNSLLGGKKIYNSQIAPYSDEFPRITMYEVGNDDFDGADDKPVFTDYRARIDLWLKSDLDLSKISKQIKKVLRVIEDLNVSTGPTFYENDTEVHHKVFDINLTIETE